MTETYYVGAYWGPREDSLDQCADRALRWFSRLREIDAAFATWFELGSSRRQALSRPVEPDRQTITELLNRGRNRKDGGNRAVIPELGFRIDLWNGGDDEESVKLSAACGAYTLTAPNNCILRLPRSGSVADRFLRVSALWELVSATIACWEPDHAVVTSRRISDLLDLPVEGVEVGWLTYVSPKHPFVADPPSQAKVEPLGSGQLVVTTEERFTAERPEHLEIARGIARCLGVFPTT